MTSKCSCIDRSKIEFLLQKLHPTDKEIHYQQSLAMFPSLKHKMVFWKLQQKHTAPVYCAYWTVCPKIKQWSNTWGNTFQQSVRPGGFTWRQRQTTKQCSDECQETRSWSRYLNYPQWLGCVATLGHCGKFRWCFQTRCRLECCLSSQNLCHKSIQSLSPALQGLRQKKVISPSPAFWSLFNWRWQSS